MQAVPDTPVRTIYRTHESQVHKHGYQHLPIRESRRDILHLKLLLLSNDMLGCPRTLMPKTLNNPIPLRLFKKLGRLWVVENAKVRDKRNNDRRKALEDKNPAPARVSRYTIHFLESYVSLAQENLKRCITRVPLFQRQEHPKTLQPY